ncbi:MAG: hypothetical protein HWE39_13155 [Oceanospirillaceae bacterium]|nr:hypothetical protein [Oceanospirillaceae bacterium]
MLNKTHAEHFFITLGVDVALWIVTLPFQAYLPLEAWFGLTRSQIAFFALVVVGLPVVGVFIGREMAQHSYKLALSRGWRWGETMPVKWYEGLTTGWSPDSVLDVLSSFAAYLLLLFLGYLCILM